MNKKICMQLLIALLCSSIIYGQDNAITISSFTINTKLTPNVKGWGSIPAALLVVAQNIRWGDRPMRLVLTIKKGDTKICGNQDGMQVEYFKVRSFQTNELLGALGGCSTLPSGDYTLCAKFIGADSTGRFMPISAEVCKPFNVGGGSTDAQKYTGPMPVFPENNKVFTETDAKKPITFRCTPVVPKPQEPIIYHFRVWPVVAGQTPMQAMNARQPVVEKDVENLTQTTVTSGLFPCGPNCNFVWAVQATDREGKAYGDNNGASEPAVFGLQNETQNNIPSINISCTAPVINYPENGTAFNKSANSIEIKGMVYGESKNVILKLYKISNDPNLVNDLKQRSKSGLVFSPLEMFDYKGAAKNANSTGKNYDLKIERSNNNSNSFSASIPTTDLEHGSYFVVAENGNCASTPLAFSMSAGCGTNLSTVAISCKAWVNGLPTYTVSIVFNNIPPLPGGQNCSTVMNSITLPAGTGSISTPVTLPTTIPSGGSSPAVTFTYTPATLTQTNVTFNYTGIWSDGNGNTSNFNSNAITLPSCVCNACEGIQWNNTTSSSSLQGNNFNIIQAVNPVATGLGNIVTAKAEIISFERYVGDSCMSCNKDWSQWGNFTAGTYASVGGGLANATTPVSGYTHHSIYWATTAPGSFNLSISTPPLSNLSCCCDRVAVTIRYTLSFKDAQTGVCKMCSFVKRYEQKKGNCAANPIPTDVNNTNPN